MTQMVGPEDGWLMVPKKPQGRSLACYVLGWCNCSVIGIEMVGPFRVLEGVKITDLLKWNFVLW